MKRLNYFFSSALILAFLTSFAKLFHSVYHIYFTSITEDEVIELASHQAIVDAIQDGDGQQAFLACQALLNAPHIREAV